jgi:hypothetical protein
VRVIKNRMIKARIETQSGYKRVRKGQQVQVLPFSKELHCTSFSVLSVTLSCDLNLL